MKKHILNMILCLVLVLSLSVSVAAANLNTANIRVGDGTVEIGPEEDAVLASLHESGRTAQLSIPVPSDYNAEAEYYVQKDSELIVTIEPVVKDGFMQFPVPGAGLYEIKLGPAPTLQDQLKNPPENGEISSLPLDVLTEDIQVSGDLVITASGTIKGEGGTKTLTVVKDSTLAIQNLNGGVNVKLGVGDTISFDTSGKATITVAENKNKADKPVGYGSFLLTTVNQEGKAVTQKFFMVNGEEFSVLTDGTVDYQGDFGAADVAADLPPYRVMFEKQDNDHVTGDSGRLVSECNGLYDHYTTIELVLQGAKSEPIILAAKVGNQNVLAAPGIAVKRGSTILELDSNYLNTLPAGTHDLYFYYDDDGVIGTKLQIKRVATGTTAQTTSQADPTNPKTGDSVMGILVMLLGSTAGLTGVCAGKRKVR